ncbi:DUF3558 domain-containing protein [Saccharopolyspora rhizosphaerae]|uniref:DUF3558 domain-containing protein n=1 Tax=Saccharopolyspora rhizosphaerae TaxID=2492662 RepID=A0A426JR48_9PSEU|nr:DUF3558 family protein [Saccharopolyspora rhizosphaerae]RRO15616.1 DUF3558 domain-containing protein [Saccharopolyspora rhizosphaerae]
MNTVSRTLIATAAGMALLGVSACSGNESGESTGNPAPPPQAKAITSFDPCTFFAPEELTSLGLSTQSEDGGVVEQEPGCQWQGEEKILTLLKNADQTVESYETSGNWDSYTKKSIAGRSGAVAVETGATGQGGCTVLVNAGGGVAVYGVDGLMRDSVDACGEAEKVANQTASRLPE